MLGISVLETTVLGDTFSLIYILLLSTQVCKCLKLNLYGGVVSSHVIVVCCLLTGGIHYSTAGNFKTKFNL